MEPSDSPITVSDMPPEGESFSSWWGSGVSTTSITDEMSTPHKKGGFVQALLDVDYFKPSSSNHSRDSGANPTTDNNKHNDDRNDRDLLEYNSNLPDWAQPIDDLSILDELPNAGEEEEEEEDEERDDAALSPLILNEYSIVAKPYLLYDDQDSYTMATQYLSARNSLAIIHREEEFTREELEQLYQPHEDPINNTSELQNDASGHDSDQDTAPYNDDKSDRDSVLFNENELDSDTLPYSDNDESNAADPLAELHHYDDDDDNGNDDDESLLLPEIIDNGLDEGRLSILNELPPLGDNEEDYGMIEHQTNEVSRDKSIYTSNNNGMESDIEDDLTEKDIIELDREAARKLSSLSSSSNSSSNNKRKASSPIPVAAESQLVRLEKKQIRTSAVKKPTTIDDYFKHSSSFNEDFEEEVGKDSLIPSFAISSYESVKKPDSQDGTQSRRQARFGMMSKKRLK